MPDVLDVIVVFHSVDELFHLLLHKNEIKPEKTKLLCGKWTASVSVILPMYVTMNLTLKGTISIPRKCWNFNPLEIGILDIVIPQDYPGEFYMRFRQF